MQAETALRSALPPAAEELLETYQIAVAARDSAAAEQAYKSGFQLAVQLILEGRISYLTPGKEDSGE